MGLNKSVISIMAILVTVLVVSTVAVPIVENSQTEIKTTENNSTELYAMSTDLNSKIVVQIGPTGMTVNDVVFNKGNSIYHVITEGLAIKQTSTGYYGYDFVNSTVLFGTEPITITFENGSFTYVKGSTFTGSYTKIFYPSENGTYGYFQDTKTNVSKNTVYYALTMGGSISSDQDLAPVMMLELKDGAQIGEFIKPTTRKSGESNLSPFTGTYSITDMGVLDKITYTLDNPKFNYTGASVTSEKAIIIAPIEYTVITENDSAIISMLTIIPLLLFLVPIFVAVAALKGRTD